MANKFQSVRGFNDVLPPDSAWWQRLHGDARATFAAYGYAEVITPVLEATALFERSIGAATDVVEKEMFTFRDRENDSLTLRPEFTAGVVRAGLEHGLLHNQQQRWWSAGPVFRHERPQAGRYRQFHQLNAEAYGIAGPDIDVELIALSARLLRRLGVAGAVRLELNSLGTGAARARYREALIAFLRGREDRLDENSRRRLELNPLRALDSKDPGTRAAVADAPSLLDYLDEESAAHFRAVQNGLQALGIAYTVNPRIVRGLDYYSRTVFEWTTDQLGAQGTVLAGGRYDGLVEQLGGSATPAIGWAAGVERLILLMKQASPDAPGDAQAHAYLCWLGDAAGRAAAVLAERLRDTLPALRLVVNAGGGKLPAQFKRADRSGARVALILGDDETARQSVQVKYLGRQASADSTQAECSWADLPAKLAGLLQP